MRQSVEATRNNPAVQAAQAAMAERPGQGQGQGQGPGQGLGPRSASGRRAALSGADQGTMAVQSRQILEEMSKHAWWRAGQVCYFCMGQRVAKRATEKPRRESVTANASSGATPGGEGGPAGASRAVSPTAEQDELTPLSHMHHRYVDCPKRRAAGEKEHTAEAITLALASIGSERAELHAQLAVFKPLAELAAAAKLDLARCEGQIALLNQLTPGYDADAKDTIAPPPPADKYLFYGPLYYKAYAAAFRSQHAYIGKAIAEAVRLPHNLGPAPTCWGQLKGIYASSARTEALRSHVTEHHVRDQAREINLQLSGIGAAPQLLWLTLSALRCPLPPLWQQTGPTLFVHLTTGEHRQNHPLTPVFRETVRQLAHVAQPKALASQAQVDSLGWLLFADKHGTPFVYN